MGRKPDKSLMKKNEIQELIELLQGTDVSEIEIENEGRRVRIRRGLTPDVQDIIVQSARQAPAAGAPAEAGSKTAPGEGETDSSMVTVTSPIVGTFYRSPSPELPPYVDMGSDVAKGQVLCIIEAMKLMNEIESETDGNIVRILAENGQAVEYGQPLFIINPQ